MIRPVYELHSKRGSAEGRTETVGFSEIHIRSLIPLPIATPTMLSELLADMGLPDTLVTGLRVRDAPGPAVEGFAFQLGHIAVFGTARDDSLEAICFTPAASATTIDEDASRRFAEALVSRDLAVVDWPSAKLYVRKSDIESFLSGRTPQP